MKRDKWVITQCHGSDRHQPCGQWIAVKTGRHTGIYSTWAEAMWHADNEEQKARVRLEWSRGFDYQYEGIEVCS